MIESATVIIIKTIMSIGVSHTASRRYISIIFTILFTLLTFNHKIWAGENINHDLHFTKPVPTPGLVPPDWVSRSVRHSPQLGEMDLALTLDQQMYAGLLPVIEKYAKVNDLKISVNEGTCGTTAGMIMRKAVDIGGYCCPPGKLDRLPGLRYHTLGIAALTLFVHPDNPVTNITIEEARALFKGEIRRWSDLSDPAAKTYQRSVKLVTHIHCKLRPGHWKLLLENQDLFSPDILDYAAAPDLIAEVASDPRAIGYETLAMQDVYSHLGELKALRINAISPADLESLAKGNYPFYRVFNITSWEGAAANPISDDLVRVLLENVNNRAVRLHLAPSPILRKYGWKFKGNELVGLPESFGSANPETN